MEGSIYKAKVYGQFFFQYQCLLVPSGTVIKITCGEIDFFF